MHVILVILVLQELYYLPLQPLRIILDNLLNVEEFEELLYLIIGEYRVEDSKEGEIHPFEEIELEKTDQDDLPF